jgi:hypothetical protein
MIERMERMLPVNALEDAVDRIAAREVDPYTAAEELAARMTAR